MDNTKNVDELSRKLIKLKLNYTDDEMRAFLKGKLKLSSMMMKLIVRLSKGRKIASKTTIYAKGIDSEKLSSKLADLMEVLSAENRKINLSAYPEHYVLHLVKED